MIESDIEGNSLASDSPAYDIEVDSHLSNIPGTFYEQKKKDDEILEGFRYESTQS